MDEKEFKTSEVANILHYSQQEIRNLIAQGKFHNAYKISPRQYRIPEGDVNAFREKQGTQTADSDNGEQNPRKDTANKTKMPDKIGKVHTEENNVKLSQSAKGPALNTARTKIKKCPAPPDNIDVVIIKKWGVPAERTSEILLKWVLNHQLGKHEICQLYSKFKEDLVIRKTSFKTAMTWLEDGIWAIEQHNENVLQDIELKRLLRPDKGLKYEKAYFEEIEKRDKPANELRSEHIKEIEVLLDRLREDITSALSTLKYDDVFKIEATTSFQSMMHHCVKVNSAFMKLKLLLGRFHQVNLDVTHSENDPASLKTKKKQLLVLQKKIVTSAKDLYSVVDNTLEKKSYLQEWCGACIQDTNT